MIGLLLGLALAGPYEDGVSALKEGDSARALSLLQQAVDADDSSVEAHWELGWAYWVTDDFAGSARSWAKVKELKPDHAEVDAWLQSANTRAELLSSTGENEAVGTKASDGSVRIVAAGDTMMGTDLRRGPSGLAPGNGENIFDGVREVLQAGDITFLNLEGPLADGLPSTKCRPGSTACYAFRTPTRYGAALKGAGVDVVSLANNHAMDLGAAGQQATMDALDAIGIAHAGRYGDVASIEANGVKIAVLAAHSGSCCLNVNRIEEVQAAIRKADEDHDLVFLSYHAGAEGGGARHVPGKVEIAWGERRGDVKALSRAAIDAGADLILGHGPHVLRAMEVYKGRLIAYSLGNFMGYKQFGTGGGVTGHTVIVDANLASNGVLLSAKLHGVKLDEISQPSLDDKGVGLGHIRELSAADFPESGVQVAEDGTLSWGSR